jgi:hypothetical protein
MHARAHPGMQPCAFLLNIIHLCRTRLDFSRHQMLRFEEKRTNDLLQTLLPERITIQLKQARAEQSPAVVSLPGIIVRTDGLQGRAHRRAVRERHHSVQRHRRLHLYVLLLIPLPSLMFRAFRVLVVAAYSATLHAREVVNFLNTLYTTFDHLTVVHEVLKVSSQCFGSGADAAVLLPLRSRPLVTLISSPRVFWSREKTTLKWSEPAGFLLQRPDSSNLASSLQTWRSTWALF